MKRRSITSQLAPRALSCATVVALCTAPLSIARAETTGVRNNYVIVGAASIPEFEGAADQSTKPLIAVGMRWNNRYVAWDGTSGRFNMLNHNAFEFGPAVNVTFGRDDDITALRVRKLGEIDDAIEAGVFVAYNTANVFQDDDVLRFSIQALKDTTDTHEGSIAEFATSYRVRMTERVAITATGSVSFANDAYAKTYFSIDASSARTSGLPESVTDGGTKDTAISLGVNYDINHRWSVFGFAKAARLIGDFSDSPIVELVGNKNQLTAGLGIGWRF